MTSTKKSLAFSALSLVICLAMLIGTTFAWFTDSVESGKNQIIAGNLDVELFNGTTKVGSTTKLFSDVEKWEPGAAAFETLQVKNVGNLALKYQLSFLFENETKVDGHGLSEVLKIGTYAGEITETTKREDVIAAVTDFAPIASFAKSGNLAANTDDTAVTYVIYWQPTENDNLFNMNNDNQGKTLSIDFWVKLVATQDTVEADSFDKFYDAETPWLGGTADVPAEVEGVITINTAEELAGFAKEVNAGTDYANKTIKLAKDIDLNNIAWTPIKANNSEKHFIFDGNSKTIKNLNVAGEKAVGLFSHATSCTIKNLTINGATATGINHVAAIAGNALCTKIENCTVKNAVITTAVKNNDDGDKAGAIAGYLSGEPEAHITGCTVENVTVTGYRDTGALLGYANKTSTVTGNTVKNSTVINDRSHNYKNYTTDAEFDVNAVVGEAVPAATVSDNTATNVNVVAGATIGEAVKKAIADATEGATVLLPTTTEAIELPAISQKNVEIVGAVDKDGNALTKVKKAGAITGDNTTVKNIVFESAPVTIGANDGIKKDTGIVLDNCDFATTKSESMIQAYDAVTVKNSKFESNAYNARAIGWSYANGGDIVIENCEFNMSGSNMAIQLDGGDGQHKIYIRNCKFNVWIAISCGSSSVKEVVVENCEIDGYINIWTNFTSKNNIYKGKTDFDFKHVNGTKFTSTGDTWQTDTTEGLFYSFNDTNEIMIDGVRNTTGNKPE